MTYKELYTQLLPLYDEREAKAIVRLLIEETFGLTFTDICCGAVEQLSAEDGQLLEKHMERLRQGEPIQYVLGNAMFAGRSFHVAPGVLIPRPETETLCQWVEEDFCRPFCGLLPPAPKRLLDVGTGSGCIAITLALDIPNTDVSAWDISPDALLIARHNAHSLGAKVNLQLHDALHATDGGPWDAIVSNPPYICEQERKDMQDNVLNHEPQEALFVPDDDPLLFYRAIALYARERLERGGSIYFETNPLYTDDTAQMLESIGFRKIEKREDPFGKLRFIKAQQA